MKYVIRTFSNGKKYPMLQKKNFWGKTKEYYLNENPLTGEVELGWYPPSFYDNSTEKNARNLIWKHRSQLSPDFKLYEDYEV